MGAKQKGSAGERELCRWLYENLNLPSMPERNLEQVRSGGADIILPPFCFEVKRVEKLNVYNAWNQVVAASNTLNESGEYGHLEPVLGFRKNRQPWEFAISARHIGVDRGYLLVSGMVFRKWVEGIWQPD